MPKRYEVPESVLMDLANRGCEVGIHGLYHDGRDLESARMLQERLPEMVRYAQQWGAGGFRSPATQRGWDLIAALPFDYDSSYPDTDPFEPQGGGCCSWLPFMNGRGRRAAHYPRARPHGIRHLASARRQGLDGQSGSPAAPGWDGVDDHSPRLCPTWADFRGIRRLASSVLQTIKPRGVRCRVK